MGITIDGLVSGLDTTGIITKLVELEKRPITLLEDKKVRDNEKLQAWQEANSRLLAFETAAQKINTALEFQAVSGTFKNNNTLQGDIVSLTANSNVASGTYSLNVSQLATQHKVLLDQGFTSTTSSNAALAGIQIATSTGTQTFGATTLESLKDAINSSNIGVSANIINTSATSTPNYRLQIVSDGVGAASAFSTTGSAGIFGSDLSFTTAQTAQDAVFTLDGLSINRSSNSFSDVIDGVEMQLLVAGSGTLTFASDADAIVSKVEEFVSAYNNVNAFMDEQFAYNQDTEQKPLFGNSTLLSIQDKLRSIMSSAVPGLSATDPNVFTTLSQVGILTDDTNTMTIDTALLTQAIKSNIAAVKNLFASSGTGTYSFVAADGATTAGTYSTRVVDNGGTLEMQLLSAASGWITMQQSITNIYEGPKGSSVEGLAIRATALAAGDTGSISVAVGLAEQIAYNVGYITEYSTAGSVFNERRHLEDAIDDYDTQIIDLTQRVQIKQESLTRKYAQLEVALSQMKGQSDYLTSQLNNLAGFGGTKR